MYFIREQDDQGVRMEAPYARVVKHLIAPWNAGSTRLWLGISVIEPNSKSNLHAHENQEEVFYCLSGRGIIKVEDEEVEASPGTCVFVPFGAAHQLINTQSDQLLRILSATAPPFSQDGWTDTHEPPGK
ncbi:MAG: cupin domain-containing protein [Anaerolineales bacterium]|nr:cupin domain-containing protein [Anaerolineales bacterium]